MPYRALARLIDLRPCERRAALLAFATLGTVLAAHALLETARDALFLASLPASHLPWVYLAMAALGIGVTRLYGGQSATGRGLALWLAGSSLITLSLWGLTAREDAWVLYLVYLWPGLFATIAVVQFWVMLGRHFDLTEAKRVFGVVGTGAILGAVVGSGLARAVVAVADGRHVVLVAAIILVVGAALPGALDRALGHPPARAIADDASARGAAERVRSEKYARELGLLIVFATIALTLLDYVFKSVVAQNVARSELGEFFATFNIAINAGAFLIQIFVVSLVMRSLRLSFAMSVLPLALAGGAAAVAVGGALAAAISLKGADGVLRHSLHRTAMEVLYVPMSDSVRVEIKPFIDVAGQRGGQALASVIILIVAAACADPIGVSAIIIALSALLWISLALRLDARPAR